MIILIVVFSFLAYSLLILGLYNLATRSKREIKKRIKFFLVDHRYLLTEKSDEASTFLVRFQTFIAFIGRFLQGKSFNDKLAKALYQANISLRVEELLLLSGLGGIVGFLAGIGLHGFLLAFSLGGLGVATPFLLLLQRKQVRRKKILAQLDDVLTIMVSALRAGHSFQQALEMGGKEVGGPLAVELTKTSREITLGASTEDALRNFSQRVESDEIDLLVTAVLIQRQIGGNLAEILENISKTLRDRVKLKGEINTLTAQGKISGLIVGLIPPILLVFIYFLNPLYLKVLFVEPVGIMMLLAGIFMEGLGILFIKKIVNIEDY